MNANLSLPARPLTIRQWQTAVTAVLAANEITSARLDTLILLEDALGKDRSWLLAHDDQLLQPATLTLLNAQILQRSQHYPLAYIRGFVEFYGRRYQVDERVLIPRPETEELITMALGLPLPVNAHLIDVGTGSGCIAISLKLERPDWHVTATDVSTAALAVASSNSKALQADIRVQEADLLAPFLASDSGPQPAYQLVTANMPYVAPGYAVSPEAAAEPELALFAGRSGYALIERLLPQAASLLAPGGFLLLESDPWQQPRITKIAAGLGLSVYEQYQFHLCLRRTNQL